MAQLKAQVDKLLSGVSQAYIPQNFICDQILPGISVKQKSGLLGTYGTNHLRVENTIAGGRGAYRRVEVRSYSSTSYLVDTHGLEDIVTEDDYDNVEDPFDAESDTVMGLTTLQYIRKEKAIADTINSTSIITQYTTLSGTSQFSDYLNSDPISIFSTGRVAVKDGCGMFPNTAIMSDLVFEKLRFHPQILDALGYKQARPGGLTLPELASAMMVDKILVGSAMYESADEGQTSSLANIWGKHIVLAVCPDAAAKYQISLGYMIRLSSRPPRRVYKYPINNPPNAMGIIVDDSYDMLISKAAAAYLISAAIA
jgi:hypothetical protein